MSCRKALARDSQRERERERETDRQRGREFMKTMPEKRERERQTDRQRLKQINRQRGREFMKTMLRERERERERGRQADRQTEKQPSVSICYLLYRDVKGQIILLLNCPVMLFKREYSLTFSSLSEGFRSLGGLS